MTTVQVIVNCRSTASMMPVKDFITSINGVIINEIPSVDMIVAEVPKDKLAVLRSNKNVLSVNIDEPVELLQASDWNKDVMNIKKMHNAGHKGAGVVVGVVDSGVDYNNNNLKNNCLSGHNLRSSQQDNMDIHGHGTKMAGLICAHGPDVIGIAPEAKIECVNIYDADLRTSSSYIIQGIDWCIDHGASIINLSMGTSLSQSGFDKIVQKAKDNGVILVAATGNDPSVGVASPAANPGIIAVTGLRYDNNYLTSDPSSHGPQVNICAPARRILSTGLNNYTQFAAGTSAACANMVGFLALLKGMNPGLSSDALVSKLYSLCITKDDIVIGDLYGKGMPVATFEPVEQTFPIDIRSNPPNASITVS